MEEYTGTLYSAKYIRREKRRQWWLDHLLPFSVYTLLVAAAVFSAAPVVY